MSKKGKIDENGRKRGPRGFHGIVARVFLALLSGAVTYGILYLAALPRQYDIREGEVGTDIKAPRDIVDAYTTQININSARDNVEDKYRQDDTITALVLNRIENCFTAMDEVRIRGQAAIDAIMEERAQAIEAYNAEQERIAQDAANRQKETAAHADPTPAPSPASTPMPVPTPLEDPVVFDESFYVTCDGILPISLSREDIYHLVTMDKEEYDNLKDVVGQLVFTAMQSGIKEEYLQSRVTQINTELMSAIHGFSQGTQRLGMNIVSTYLEANFIYDEEATEAARDQAEAAVANVVYKKGQYIVQEGYPVTHAQYLMLQELGLIREDGVDYEIMAGLAVFVLLLMAFTVISLSIFERETFRDLRKYAALCLIYMLALGISWGAVQIHPYLQPMGLGALLIAILVGRRPALAMNSVLAVLAGFISGGGRSGITAEALAIVASVLVSGALGVHLVSHSPQRSTLLYAGAAMGLVGAMALGAFDLMSHIGWQQIWLSMGMGLAAGVFSSFACMGLLPLWESIFRLVTPMKLLEISNPNQPLLRRLLLEAPGSYHHSVIVGNLAESAAEAIGADVLLARAGAYYHDIGKLVRPYFFGENQVGAENPHDSISPELSTRIITAHTRDGVELAREHRLPAPILDAIVQHHGTTAVSFFYHKKMEAAQNKDEIDIQDYRYGGERPRTRETAILMLADSVEAAVRSLGKPSPQKVEELIRDVIRNKITDGQLDECPLTLRDLETIVFAFKKTLNGVYHERVEYPSLREGEKPEKI